MPMALVAQLGPELGIGKLERDGLNDSAVFAS